MFAILVQYLGHEEDDDDEPFTFNLASVLLGVAAAASKSAIQKIKKKDVMSDETLNILPEPDFCKAADTYGMR